MREIVEGTWFFSGTSNRGSHCQRMAMNGDGVRENATHKERDAWGFVLLGLVERERQSYLHVVKL